MISTLATTLHCHFEMEIRTRQTKNPPSYNTYLGVRHVLEGLGAVGDMLLCIRLSGVVDLKL